MKRMKRRTFLRAAGVGASSISIGLPILDAMLDGNGLLVPKTYAQPAGAPLNLFTWFFPYGTGHEGERFNVEEAGRDYTMSPSLRVIEQHREDFLVLGRMNKYAFDASNVGDKHRLELYVFNAAYATDNRDGAGGPSFEWIASEHLQGTTPIRILPATLGTDVVWSGRNQREDGYSDPRTLFQRVFGDTPDGSRPIDPLTAPRRSVLDYVLEDVRRLQGRFNGADRARLDQHFESVRQLERRVFEGQPDPTMCDATEPTEIFDSQSNERVRLLQDLQVKAMECGLTRVANFSMRGSRSRQFPWNPRIRHFDDPGDGNGGGMHGISHRYQDDFTAITEDQLEQFGYLLERMKSVQWGTTNLLYNSVVFCASGLRGRAHTGDNIQVLLAGNAGGQLETGRSVRVNSDIAYERVFPTIFELLGLGDVSSGDDRFVGDGPLTEVL